jgi:hypothetical protein
VKHPLFAKKKRDFLIWSKGVELCAEVRASLRGRRNRRGHNLTWPVAKIEEFRQLAAELRRVRAYPGESSAPAPAAFLPAPLRNPQGFLFDDMGDD